MGSEPRPDDLTRREREVLDLIRLGLTNEEIAGRLGISLDGAKYHVSQILSKLGVGSREEAATLAPVEARPWWTRALGWSLAAKLAGAAAVLAAAAGIGVLAWGVLATGGAGNEEAQTLSLPGPHAGDHWHATYVIFVCGERQPAFPVWEGIGIHTHGDGIIHMHPFSPSEEGAGARLVKFFEYGGGLLSQTEMRLPGGDRTLRNGEACPGGSEAVLQVYLNGQPLADWSTYIPQDGDRVQVVFGREGELVIAESRTIIPEVQATRAVEIAVTDDGTDTGIRFEPDRIEVATGETVKIVITNTGQMSHVFRAAGNDGQYGTGDDYVATPNVIGPGGRGVAVVRLDAPGEAQFRDDALRGVTGIITVREGASPP